MNKRKVVFQWSVFAIIILAGITFASVSFADYGTVVQGGLCGSGNSGDSGGGGNSNPGYTDDTNGDNWAGYAHHVGLKYMKIGKKSSDRWKGSKVWSINQIPAKQDFRVKLKRKGGRWKDVCAEVWFSHNKYFTSDDKYLGKKCKKLSKKKYRKKKMTIKI